MERRRQKTGTLGGAGDDLTFVRDYQGPINLRKPAFNIRTFPKDQALAKDESEKSMES
jgi:hypothetical protein